MIYSGRAGRQSSMNKIDFMALLAAIIYSGQEQTMFMGISIDVRDEVRLNKAREDAEKLYDSISRSNLPSNP